MILYIFYKYNICLFFTYCTLDRFRQDPHKISWLAAAVDSISKCRCISPWQLSFLCPSLFLCHAPLLFLCRVLAFSLCRTLELPSHAHTWWAAGFHLVKMRTSYVFPARKEQQELQLNSAQIIILIWMARVNRQTGDGATLGMQEFLI